MGASIPGRSAAGYQGKNEHLDLSHIRKFTIGLERMVIAKRALRIKEDSHSILRTRGFEGRRATQLRKRRGSEGSWMAGWGWALPAQASALGCGSVAF